MLLTLSLFSWSTRFRNLIGEHRLPGNHRPLAIFFIPIFALFSLYLLLTFTPESLLPTQQLSIVIISVAFAALPLAVTSISDLDTHNRTELIGITQKFILVVILFTIFIVVNYMFGQKPFISLDVMHPIWNSINGWAIAISLLIEAFSYYCSVALFIIGSYDLVVAFANLRFSPNDGQQPQPDDHNPVEPDPVPPNTANPAPDNTAGQTIATDERKPKDSVKHLILGIFFGGMALSLLFGILIALVWPNTQNWSISLSIQLGGLAISFLLIYLLVDRYIKNERRKRWEKVRSILIRNIKRQTAGLLTQIEIKFIPDQSVMDFAKNDDSVIREARQLSTSMLVHDWPNDERQLNYFVGALNNDVNTLVWIITHFSHVLDEDFSLFEKILDTRNKMNNLSAVSSMRFSNASGQELIRTEDNPRINQAFQQLLIAAIAVYDETGHI